MKKHLPNLLTCMNLTVGCVGIYFTLTNSHASAIYFVVLAGFFDFLDGFAARLLNVRSEIGKQLDSLADLVSFGLLPSFFMLVMLQEVSSFYWVSLSIVIFSAIRLAIFNTDDTQTDSFRGLPTPANAIMLTSLSLFSFELYEYTLISICIFSAMMLVSPIRLVAIKFSSFSWRGNEARWLLIFGVLLLLFVFGWATVPFIIPFYVLISLISGWMKKK